jgi:hypothetical protein
MTAKGDGPNLHDANTVGAPSAVRLVFAGNAVKPLTNRIHQANHEFGLIPEIRGIAREESFRQGNILVHLTLSSTSLEILLAPIDHWRWSGEPKCTRVDRWVARRLPAADGDLRACKLNAP